MDQNKKNRGIGTLLSTADRKEKLESNSSTNKEEKQNLQTNKDWMRVGILMHPDDHERYRNFFWFMKNQSGNSHWGHKELQNHLMDIVEEKYGKIPERTDKEKEFEEGKKGRK